MAPPKWICTFEPCRCRKKEKEISWIRHKPDRSAGAAVTVPADRTNNQGDSGSLAIRVANPAGGTPAHTAANMPNGLSMNSITLGAGGAWRSGVTATNGTCGDTESFHGFDGAHRRSGRSHFPSALPAGAAARA